MSRALEDKAYRELEPHLNSEVCKKLRAYLLARIETHHCLLEMEEAPLTRGQCREDRHLLKVLSPKSE